MPRKRRKGIQRTELTWPEFCELWLGPLGPSAFASPFLARAAWYQHRGEFMADHDAGSRPWGWWKYESSEQPKRDGRTVILQGREVLLPELESDALARLGKLAPWEVARLAAIEQIINGAGDDDDGGDEPND
ncbi:MAG: hypothetical protein Q7T33_10195 [Dehalococcoidia bacterium]|nr:hypothetical protein [Dehalococcoidia bacterium]